MTDAKTETAAPAKKHHCGTKSESAAPVPQTEKKEHKKPSGAGCCGG